MTVLSDLKASAPADMERRIQNVLEMHVGIANGIKLPDILRHIYLSPTETNRRNTRDAIHTMRKRGILIGSTNQAGYFMISSLIEGEYVIDTEFTPRIADLSETTQILKRGLREQYGDAVQAQLL